VGGARPPIRPRDLATPFSIPRVSTQVVEESSAMTVVEAESEKSSVFINDARPKDRSLHLWRLYDVAIRAWSLHRARRFIEQNDLRVRARVRRKEGHRGPSWRVGGDGDIDSRRERKKVRRELVGLGMHQREKRTDEDNFQSDLAM